MDPSVIEAITQQAQRHGFDPADWLAIADRESSLNPGARAGTSSAAGLFQMLRANQQRYGHGPTAGEQAQAYGGFATDLRNEMKRHLGRDPNGAELYAGHYWGGGRGARIAGGQYHADTPVQDVFTPNELAANPALGRHGTVGNLWAATSADITRRRAKFGGAGGDDLSGFGDADTAVAGTAPATSAGNRRNLTKSAGVDLSAFGDAGGDEGGLASFGQ